MPTRTEVLELYGELKSWRKVGNALGVNAAVAFRYATSDYMPKREDIVEALDLPKPTVIMQLRNSRGRFTKHEGEATTGYVNQD